MFKRMGGQFRDRDCRPFHQFSSVRMRGISSSMSNSPTMSKHVKQGDVVTIEVKAVKRTANAVKLSLTSREGTDEYDVNLINGVGSQAYTFKNAGSVILKAADSADPKHFTTKSLHVQYVPVVPGGKK